MNWSDPSGLDWVDKAWNFVKDHAGDLGNHGKDLLKPDPNPIGPVDLAKLADLKFIDSIIKPLVDKYIAANNNLFNFDKKHGRGKLCPKDQATRDDLAKQKVDAANNIKNALDSYAGFRKSACSMPSFSALRSRSRDNNVPIFYQEPK